jgi:hypothetical protein
MIYPFLGSGLPMPVNGTQYSALRSQISAVATVSLQLVDVVFLYYSNIHPGCCNNRALIMIITTLAITDLCCCHLPRAILNIIYIWLFVFSALNTVLQLVLSFISLS